MATFKLITFIFSVSSLGLSSFSLDPAPIIHNYVTINFCEVDSTSTKSNVKYDSPTTTDPNENETTANPCQMNPCLYGGSCVATYDKKDYRCINCPYPMGGINCSDLTCSPNCFRVDDRVFFIYPNDNRSFTASYFKCQEEGMTMAIMKDSTLHKHVRKQLAVINADHLDEQICYWIGLNRTSDTTPWEWADGVELGTYRDWAVGPFDGKHCAQMCSGTYVYRFTSDFCQGDINWKFYTLCEKRFPFILQN